MADQKAFTPGEQQDASCQSDPEPCTGTSPVVVDLDRNGFRFSGDPVFFDIDADGRQELISWTSGSQKDAFLCLDRNQNGLIDNGGELFGDSTPMLNGATAAHGFLALAEFDEPPHGNLDGAIDAEDDIFDLLCLWTDENHDGYSDPWEIQSLDGAGIRSFDLDFRVSRQVDAHGNWLLYLTFVKLQQDGKFRKTKAVDVFFRRYDE